jgi:hypothetical protein
VALLLRLLEIVGVGELLSLLDGAGLVIDDDLGKVVALDRVNGELQRAILDLELSRDGRGKLRRRP